MSGKPSRDKGCRGERDLVKKLKAAGLDAKRVPLSGACDGFKGDVVVAGICDEDYCEFGLDMAHNCKCGSCGGSGFKKDWTTIECKVRARGFKFLYDNIPDDGVLAVKSDRNEWLIVQRLDRFIEGL